MIVSSIASSIFYAMALGGYAVEPAVRAADVASPTLWLFILASMLGMICLLYTAKCV